MNKTYTFKHIIFALRKEYLQIEKQLEELKQYVNTSEQINNFYFHIAGNPCRLFLYLEKKKNLLDKISLLLGTYIHGRTNYEVTNEINDIYKYHNQLLCCINNKEEMQNKINNIINAEFFKNIVANNHISIPCIENEINTLLIASNHIHLINGINGDYPHLDYYPKKDILVLQSETKTITSNIILHLLNLSIDSSYLNKYHHKILDNYKEKEVLLENNFIEKEVTLEIKEDSKKLVLIPKRK